MIDKIFAEKKEFREKILAKRNAVSKMEILQKSQKIHEKLFSMPEFRKAKAVSFYVSMENEILTHKMIEEALSIGKTVVVPFIDWKKMELKMSKINSLNDLVEKRFGLLEPKNPNPFAVSKIDLIIVPGLAFDESKNRIGYGKGFYDRFLKKARKENSKLKAISLAFDFQVLKKIPSTKTDEKVDEILTESRII